MSLRNFSQLASAVMLISGTCIGAGMLGVPVLTGQAGLAPCLLINTLCWLFMLISGLFFLEAILWSKDQDNLLSISKNFLGKKGKWLGGLTFAYLYYSLLVAYFAGGSAILEKSMEAISFNLSSMQCKLLFLALFGSIVTFGIRWTNRINAVLFIGVIITFFALLCIGLSDLDPVVTLKNNWKATLLAAPVLFSTYGYHNVLPSVASFAKRNSRQLYWAVIIGTALPFLLYSLWQIFIMTSLSPESIKQGEINGETITMVLVRETQSSWILWVSLAFSFFALVTSFLGVALSMVDFLGDGFGVKNRQGIKRVGLCSLVFVPPFLLSMVKPGIFIDALSFAGGFGEATLNGLFPILFVWRGLAQGRMTRFFCSTKKVLWPMLIFTLCIIAVEILHIAGCF